MLPAVEWAFWFEFGLSWLVSAIVLVGLALAAAGGFIWVGQRISESAGEALARIEGVVQEQRGTGVPALATLVAGVGAALSGAFLSKWAGCGVAVLLAVATFVFESLAHDSGARAKAARWVFAFGAVLPFAVIVLVSLVTGGFGDVDLEMKIFGIGVIVIGALGVASGLVTFWEGRSAPDTDIPALERSL